MKKTISQIDPYHNIEIVHPKMKILSFMLLQTCVSNIHLVENMFQNIFFYAK